MSKRAPQVNYVAAADGVTIACWSVGEGPPLIITHSFVFTHAELEWQMPSLRGFYLALAEYLQVIRFDTRNTGVSDRSTNTTLDDLCLDIDAVANCFGLESFSVLAASTPAPVAITYAAKHPERVGALVLCDPDLAPGEGKRGGRLRAVTAMAEHVGEEEGLRLLGLNWVSEEELPIFTQIASSLYAPEMQPIFEEALFSWDATPSLAHVEAPTLILVADDSVAADPAQARKIAAGIPNARMVQLAGRYAPYFLNEDGVLDLIGEHLGVASTGAASAGFSAVVFVDVVDSTAYTNEVGDEAARAEIRRIEQLVEEGAQANGGRVVKQLGDGSMLLFSSPTSAVDFSLDLQANLDGSELQLRVGMAVGEPVEEDGDYFGSVVNLAARVSAEAKPRTVVVSSGTRQMLVGKPYLFEHVGSREVKGFEDPIEVYEVRAKA